MRKKGFWEKYKSAFTVTFVIGLAGALITYYIVDEIRVSRIEDRIPKTTQEMTKITDHVNEIPSDVENYKREVQLISQQKLLIEQSSKMYELYGFAMKKFKKDSLIELAKEKSRTGRDSTNKSIDKKLEYILKIIDTTQN